MMTNAPQTLTTVKLDWQRTDPRMMHEWEATVGTDVYRAFRQRSGYGWSWFEITMNGKPSNINSGSQTELPRSIRVWQ